MADAPQFPYAYCIALDSSEGDKTNASFYAGLLIAAFALAEALSGMFWGALSDRVGRSQFLSIVRKRGS